MVLNDQALLEEWSSQCNDEDVDAWHWQVKFLPKHIIEVFECMADTTNDDTATRPTEWSHKGIWRSLPGWDEAPRAEAVPARVIGQALHQPVPSNWLGQQRSCQ